MNIPATTVSNIATVIVCGMVVAFYLRYHSSPTAKTLLPNLATSLGIFGTFVGIFIGLWNFDVQHIERSIPDLLAGLKTAFITSIVGMLFALGTHIGQLIERAKASSRTQSHAGATIDTVADYLRSNVQATEALNSSLGARMAKIETALVGDGDTTLITQIQKLRTSVVDKNDELLREFRAFAATMAEQNSKALIEALKEVIRDFNAKINEQFGDNFKQLNEAVGRLLQWQEQYRIQMTEMTAQYQRALEGIESAKAALGHLADRSDKIVEISAHLDDVLCALDDKQKNLAQYLVAFSEVSAQAQKALPVITDNLRTATDVTTKALTDASDTIQKSVATCTESMKAQSKLLADGTQQMNAGVAKAMSDVSANIQKLMDESNAVILKQITALDKSLEDELKKSLTSLGTQLATLSRKFAEDYGPLTDKLRDIVRIAGSGR